MDSLDEEEGYIPGEKNIGESEVRKRYLTGVIGFLLFIVYFLIVYFGNWSKWTMILSFIPLFVGYIGIIQGKMSFCAMFAIQEVYDVSSEGGKRKSVESEKNHEKDIKKARQIHIYTIILSIISTALSYSVLNLFV